MKQHRPRWSEAELAHAKKRFPVLFAEGHPAYRVWEIVGREVGRPAHGVKFQFRMMVEPDAREQRQLAAKLRRQAKKIADETAVRPPPPEHIFAERDARYAAPRTLSAIIFGDPPIGWSALDRRSA